MSKLTAAYLAGYIDGEGYLGIILNNKGTHVSYQPVIKIASVDETTIKWLQESFGGWTHTRKLGGNQKNAYTWTLAGRKILPFIQPVIPYLKLKKPQAEMLKRRIQLYDKVGDGKGISGSNFRYPDYVMSEIKELYALGRKLNKRGVVQSERLSEVAPVKEKR